MGAPRLFRYVLAVAAALPGAAAASGGPPDPVPLTGRSAPRTPAPGELRARSVEMDLEALGGARAPGELPDAAPQWVRLDLFEEEVLVLERTERRPLAGGGYVWIGQPLDGSTGQAVLVVRNGKIYGSIRRPGSNLQIRPEPGGDHRLAQRDEDWWPEETDDFDPVWTPPSPAEGEAPSPAAPTTDPVIDVLVVYSADARAGAGSTEAIEALIALGEEETNTAYANSGVAQRIRVVHTQEVTYTETGDSALDLDRLRQTADGHLDEVHPLRDTYGADVVSLWLENTGCGRGYLMTSVSSSFAAWAFNVCRRTCATGNLTFGHELGHNMSLRHDWYVDHDTSPWVYNHGFVDIDVDLASSFRTVMAYGNRCSDTFGSSCSRLQYFSTPDVLLDGDPAGVASGTSDTCTEGVEPTTECDAHNQLALDNTATTVAAFRPATVLAQISKEVDVAFVDIGDAITYTLTVTNDSEAVANDIVIEDTVPLHTTLDPASLSPDASATGTAPGSLITWTTDTDLAPGEFLQRTFSVTASEGGVATNTATVESSSTSLTVGSNTVSTSIWERVACGFQDGFEAGALSHFWRVDATDDGRARVLSELPDTGSYSAVLDDGVAGASYSEAALVLAANLAGRTTAQLDFRWAEAGDENGASDGVFIREAEGDPWVDVLPFADSPDLEFQDGSIDLVQAAADNNLTLTDGFQIRFQFYDNFSFAPANLDGSDGYAFDNVSLSCQCSLELTDATVSGVAVEESPCMIYAGPSYTVEGTGDLTLRSPQGVVLRDGFSVLDGGVLTVELGPVS